MAERKCGICAQPGHTRRTCPVPAQRAENREMDKFIVASQAQRTEEPDAPLAYNGFADPRPIYTGSDPGPWFSAAFPGICEKGGEGFEQGEEIRADGQGGYECRDCVSDAENPPSAPLHDCNAAGHQRCSDYAPPQAWERPTAANVQMPPVPESVPLSIDVRPPKLPPFPDGLFNDREPKTAEIPVPDPTASVAPFDHTMPAADFFAAPAPAAKVHERGPDKTDRYGHRLKDPVLGDFRRYKNGNIKSVTRVTTFNKAVEDTENLTGWMKRNVLLGAAARPDVVALAHGKNHDDDKKLLNALVAQLEKEAGSKKAADVGTYVHKLTEEFDAGRATMDDIPPAYRPLITWYRDALAAAGLRIVPGMQELTTFIENWGGVSGSFDKVYEHIATGSYYIGDVKTGKTMDWGWAPIECQEAIYAHGYNRHGTYDWDTETWHPPTLRVSGTVGIVIHLPVKGDHFGTCRVLAADLERGWEYAALCGAVKATRKLSPKPVLWGDHVASLVPTPAARDWDAEFSGVADVAAAGALWEEARAAGVAPMELQRLVALAQSALRSMS